MYYIPSIFFENSNNSSLLNCFIKAYSNEQKVNNAPVFMEKHVLSFLLEGEKSIILPKHKLTFQNNSFLILKKGNCLMTERCLNDGKFKSLLIFFDNDYLLHFYEKHELKFSTTIPDKSYSVLEKDDLLNSIAHSLLPYFKKTSQIPQSIAKLKLEELLLQIIHLHGIDSISFLRNNPDYNIDIEFKKIVENNIFNNLSLNQLAFLCNMSLSSFRRKFIQLYDSTPGKWLTQKRLEKSAQLLISSGLKPSDVYLEVGFQSLSSFIHAFKKQYGVTPKKHKQNLNI